MMSFLPENFQFNIDFVNGGNHFGPGVVLLLHQIEECRSLHRASERLEIAYEKAAGMIVSLEKGLGAPILVPREDRGSREESILTAQAKKFLILHREFEEKANEQLTNLYRRITRPRAQYKYLAICGVKDSGKTTLIENLIPILMQRGHEVGMIKHASHGFSCDTPNTDTYRYQQAGAQNVAIFSKAKYRIVSRGDELAPETFCDFFTNCDIILYEGGKGLPYPKIEVARSQISEDIVSNPEDLIAICTDLPLSFERVPVVGLDEHGALADIIEDFVKEQR